MLPAFQDALVALVTSRRARERFASDPESAMSDLSLSPREKRALTGIDSAALDRYAVSLVSKRWTDVRKVWTATARIVPKLETMYRAWALENPAPATITNLAPGPSEALRAHDAIARRVSDSLFAEYTRDLMTYETLSAASRSDRALRTMTSRFSLHPICEEIRRGAIPIDVAKTEPLEYRFDESRVYWSPVVASAKATAR